MRLQKHDASYLFQRRLNFFSSSRKNNKFGLANVGEKLEFFAHSEIISGLQFFSAYTAFYILIVFIIFIFTVDMSTVHLFGYSSFAFNFADFS